MNLHLWTTSSIVLVVGVVAPYLSVQTKATDNNRTTQTPNSLIRLNEYHFHTLIILGYRYERYPKIWPESNIKARMQHQLSTY